VLGARENRVTAPRKARDRVLRGRKKKPGQAGLFL